MTSGRSVVINGDLGSGKTAVSVLLSQRLGFRRIQRDVAASGEQLIVDSRLAWYFFVDALKVHLITERTVAVQRVLGRPTAVEKLRHRRGGAQPPGLPQRERTGPLPHPVRRRQDAPAQLRRDVRQHPRLAARDPRTDRRMPPSATGARLRPGVSSRPPADPSHRRRTAPDRPEPPQPLAVGYAAPHFFAVRGHQHLSAAVRSGQTLVQAPLVAEAPDEVSGSRCDHYFKANTTPARIRAWEQAHGTELPRVETSPAG